MAMRQSQHTRTHTHRPTQPQTDRYRDRTAARVAAAVGLWLVWRIFTRICLNYFQFSQLHGPSDLTPSFCLHSHKCRCLSATMAIVQTCPGNLHTHTHNHTHIRAFAWLCLFGALCPVLEVSQFTAYVCSLMRFGPVHSALCAGNLPAFLLVINTCEHNRNCCYCCCCSHCRRVGLATVAESLHPTANKLHLPANVIISRCNCN